MKGSELLGQIIGLFILIGISFVAIGMILWTIQITETTGWGSTYSLILAPIHQPIKYEVMVLSYLEVTHSGIPTKNIIFEAIESGITDKDDLEEIIVTDGSESHEFNLPLLSKDAFDGWFGEDPYVLLIEIDDEPYRLAGSGRSFVPTTDEKIAVRKVTIPIKTATNEGSLILYVRGY